MAENTKIEWTDHTHNFWVGCTKISVACDFCYAESWAKRAGHPELWQGERRRTADANWRKPLKWNAEAAARGVRYRVFTNSLADFFDNQADPEWRTNAWRLIRATPNLTWQILTKRPQNIAKMLPADWGNGYPNVWLGTTVENQQEADRRIPHLLAVPAKVHFLSCEPLLGPVDLGAFSGPTRWIGGARGCGATHHGQGTPDCPREAHHHHDDRCAKGIDWVITGGESGPHARPTHPEWLRSLRDQCDGARIAFIHKQNGNYALVEPDHPKAEWVGLDPEISEDDCVFDFSTAAVMANVGKHAAGRLLDGVEHNGYPA